MLSVDMPVLDNQPLEHYLLLLAMVIYLAGWIPSLIPVLAFNVVRTIFVISIPAGLVLHGISIGLRWHRLDHGPFIHFYEILSSNIWSLTLVYLVFFRLYPPLQRSVICVAPVSVVLICWLILVKPADVPLPPTYDTIWLYFHVAFGKGFLGVLMIAAGLAAIILVRTARPGRNLFRELPGNESIDNMTYRCLAVALILDSLMLIVGAIWAQDAWGRYWAWDPLETWAFLTWLCIAITLHIRLINRDTRLLLAVLVISSFILAFLTFFGIPFISTAPHKGMI